MLEKKYRLPSSVRLKGARTKTFKHFILKTADSSLSFPRFAFVVSKKVDSRAVIRNKIKREATQVLQNIMDKIKKQDAVFIFKKGAAENVEQIKADIESALKQKDA